jgi:hypothetical protein
MTQWDVPPPPRPAQSIRGGRVGAGIGIAMAAHVLTIAPIVLGALLDDEGIAVDIGFPVLLIGQAVVFFACLIVGIVLTVRQDGGYGVGLLIGWAVGLLTVPVAGFGICVTVANGVFG